MRKLLPKSRHQFGAYLFLTCIVIYIVDFSSRGALSTSISNMVADTGFTKSALGAVGTGFFLCYGIVQLISGPLADRIAPHLLITAGLLGSGVFTLLTGLANTIPSMSVFWALNGVCQSAIWPAIIKILAEWMPKAQRARAGVMISVSNPGGAFLLYIISAIVFSVTGWRILFFVFTALLFGMAAFSFLVLRKLKKELDATAAEDEPDDEVPSAACTQPEQQKHSLWKLVLMSGVIVVTIPAFAQGLLREGIAMWAPTLLVEKYHLSSVVAVLLSSVLPAFNLTGAYLTSVLMKRTRDKKMLINFIFFAVAMVSIALLYLLSGISPILGVVFMAITTASQLGGGTVMNLIAIDFAKFGKSASVMGILNFSVFFGTAAASYLFGFIAESWGWDATIISWIIFAVLGGVVSLLIAPRWNRFKREMLS